MQRERFISLRWRVAVFTVVLVLAMLSVYLLAHRWSGSTSLPQGQIWAANLRAVDERAQDLLAQQRARAESIARSPAAADATSITITNPDEPEWRDNPLIHAALESGSAAGLVQTSAGTMLYTAVSESDNSGVVLVSLSAARLLTTLQAGGVAELALFNLDGTLLQATLPDVTLSPPAEIPSSQPLQSLEINERTYQVAYLPLTDGLTPIGIVGVLLPDSMPFAAEAGRQLTGLALAASAAVFIIAVFVLVNGMVARVNRITQTALKLADGETLARTGMQVSDEIGALGQALDRYADYVKERQDVLRGDLRRQRREIEHLQAVLESMPDGVIVQDADGRVILMNENARRLLGSQHGSTNVQELTAHVTDKLGPALAPGLYALGSPQQVDVNNRMLSAQAAAVMALTGHRVGTVIVLRDITEEVKRERARERLLQQLEENVQQPLANPPRNLPISDFAREITRHAVALQKMVLEMRELADPNVRAMPEPVQHPILLDTLVWSVANEWRQVAQANNLTLHVMIERSGLYVLGNERRLRWAIGNVIDNAIKYTPPGGALTLEIRDDISEGRAHLRVRDNGVGIAPNELPHVFTRFFRGNPVTPAGRAIRVPGTGQGLSTAKQIFEAHGGSVHIKSRPGVGTAVYFTVPLTAPVGLELPGGIDMEGETVRIMPTRTR